MQTINEDIIKLIDLILSHKMDYIQIFLKSNGLTFSVRKKIELKDKLIKYVVTNKITKPQLISLLNEIDGFGNQHIYLFNISNPQLQKLKDKNYVKSILKKHGLTEVYNNYKPLLLPENPEVISVTHDDESLKIRWVTGKEGFEPIDKRRERNSDNKEILIVRCLINKLRIVTRFQVSFINGNSELFIHQMPSGSNYDRERKQYLKQLDGWFNFGILDHLKVYSAISKIEDSGEVRTREVGIRTLHGSRVDIASPSKKEGILDDPDVSRVRKNIQTGFGNKGNFYWLPKESKGALSEEIRTRVYANRIAVFGERREKDINYVLGRIRHFIR